MRLTILAHGSRGDVQPYLALGLGFQRAGHTVRLAAPEMFRSFVVARGLEFAPLAGDPTRLLAASGDRANVRANPLRQVQVLLDYAIPFAAQLMSDVQHACQDADVIIHSMLTCIAGHQVALERRCLDFSALVFPILSRTCVFPNPMFPSLPMGGAYNRLTHDLFANMFWQLSRLGYAWVRRRCPALPRLSKETWPFGPDEPTIPILYGMSPHVFPKPQDWNQKTHVAGYWFLDEGRSWQPPTDLVDFVETGRPPVYIGFGSVISRAAHKLTAIVLEALQQTGQRGVLQAGWGGLETTNLPKHVFELDSAPFDWLFPRMAAVVHHGGIGTTAESLRAGLPTIVVPFIADQPFWGRRVHQLGAGPKPIPFNRLSARNLAEAIDAATSDQAMRQCASNVGRSIRSEDGIGNAVNIIERYVSGIKNDNQSHSHSR